MFTLRITVESSEPTKRPLNFPPNLPFRNILLEFCIRTASWTQARMSFMRLLAYICENQFGFTPSSLSDEERNQAHQAKTDHQPAKDLPF
jgi:hypothetical protein